MQNCGQRKLVDINEEKNFKYMLQKVALNEWLRKICSVFNDIVVLKGAWYDSLLYPKHNRKYGDIDFFLPANRINDLDIVMEKWGFYRLYTDIKPSLKYYLYNSSYDEQALSFDKLNHFSYKNPELPYIKIEVHTYLLSPYKYPKLDNVGIWDRRVESEAYGSIKIKTLDKEDDFIYAACHLCKHLINSLLANKENLEAGIDPKLIYDIARMIELRDLDWKEVVNRAVNWGTLSEVFYACRLISAHYDNIVPQNDIEKMFNLLMAHKVDCLKYSSLICDFALNEKGLYKNDECISYILSDRSRRISSEGYNSVTFRSDECHLSISYKNDVIVAVENLTPFDLKIVFSYSKENKHIETMSLYWDCKSGKVSTDAKKLWSEENDNNLDGVIAINDKYAELHIPIKHFKVYTEGTDQFFLFQCHILFFDGDNFIKRELIGSDSHYSFYNMKKYWLL